MAVSEKKYKAHNEFEQIIMSGPKIWKRNEVIRLVDLYELFTNSSFGTQDPEAADTVWAQISEQLEEDFIVATPTQCRNKMKLCYHTVKTNPSENWLLFPKLREFIKKNEEKAAPEPNEGQGQDMDENMGQGGGRMSANSGHYNNGGANGNNQEVLDMLQAINVSVKKGFQELEINNQKRHMEMEFNNLKRHRELIQFLSNAK